MKTTEQDFNRFKKLVYHYQQLLGLTQYSITCCHRKLKNPESFAEINSDNHGKCVVITLTTEIIDSYGEYQSPEIYAKYVVIHLLLSKIEYLIRARFITPGEIYIEIEKLVRRLTAAIK